MVYLNLDWLTEPAIAMHMAIYRYLAILYLIT